MQYTRPDPGFDRVATLDIETTHYKPTAGELVSIGIGVHDRGDDGSNATYETFHRDGQGEARLVERTFEQLSASDVDGLVTYNGRDFDLTFITGRLNALEHRLTLPDLLTSKDQHIDLFEDRKQAADRRNRKWPSLEGCLAAYELPEPKTVLNGDPVTNTRFGEELGPAYLDALRHTNSSVDALTDVIDHYLITDLEANLAIYYADIGVEFPFRYLDRRGEFSCELPGGTDGS